MTPAEIPFLPASELAAAIRAREVSAAEAVDAYLARIDAVGDKPERLYHGCAPTRPAPTRNAWTLMAAAGNFRGPLHGVPVGVKDQIYAAGTRTTDGSKIRADFVPDTDATVVARLKDAGAVIIGKTNMSEFAMGDPISSWFGPGPQPMGHKPQPGHVQHRQRIRHGGIPVRHLPG